MSARDRIEPTLRAACILSSFLWHSRDSWPARDPYDPNDPMFEPEAEFEPDAGEDDADADDDEHVHAAPGGLVGDAADADGDAVMR
jgi:hypothetical protein